jgi:hypothetical protein
MSAAHDEETRGSPFPNRVQLTTLRSGAQIVVTIRR